jgi:ParB-like chromosome segregation protein Spo0J
LTAETQENWPASAVERRSIDKLVPYARNARKHRPSQIAEIAGSMREFGWTVPALVDEHDLIIAGHGRVDAARMLGIKEIPVVVARGWTEAQKRAYRIADNQLALHATWDRSMLRVELADLRDQAVDLELLGFSTKDALGPADGPGDELPQGLQLEPPREYALIMCANEDEWTRLKKALQLTPVRRGGYRKGSPRDDVGTQRVVWAKDVLPRLEALPAKPARRKAAA